MSDLLLTNTIQGVGILILVLSLLYVCLLFRNTLKTSRLALVREVTERDFLAQRANEIVERNRIKKRRMKTDGMASESLGFKKVIEAKDQCSFYFTPRWT